jgi:integrase
LFPSERKGLDGSCSRATADVFRRSLAEAAARHLPAWEGRLTPHVLRHFCASQLYLAGMNLFAIQAAATPAQRLAIALAAVHAARPTAIRELTLDDIDLPSRRITLAGHRQRLGELTRNALLAWLEYRRAAWPNTANRHVLVSRISALGSEPVSADFLDKHQLRGIFLERIRRDRILQEALAVGADPLHLVLVFNIDHTNAMAYANAARNLLTSPAEQALSRRPEQA